MRVTLAARRRRSASAPVAVVAPPDGERELPTAVDHEELRFYDAEPSTSASCTGYEVEHPAPAPHPDLTAAQREILRHVGEHGSIRSCEAGAIVHEVWAAKEAARDLDGRPCVDLHALALSRKRYRAADGLEACKRLAARGFIVRREPGVWISRIGVVGQAVDGTEAA